LLSWNVRGLNEIDKRLKVRKFLRQWKADIICLQETKLEFISINIVRNLWGCLHAGWCYLPSSGASGGILSLWDKRVVEKIEVCVREYVVSCSFRNVADDFTWAFAGVYAPILIVVEGLFGRHWLAFFVGRICLCALSGEAHLCFAMTEFSDFISEQGLMDLPLSGGLSMWSNNSSWSRLDRFLVSLDWEANYPRLLKKRVPRLCSDHFPILFYCGGIQEGKKPFKFENMWLKEAGFVDRVRQWWSSYSFQGSPSFILAQKLKALKFNLLRWNTQVFGYVDSLKQACLEELHTFDRLEAKRVLDSEEKPSKSLISSDLEEITLQEEISWRQKSRVLWLKEGDKCTKFFYRLAKSNQRFNSIVAFC